MLTAGIFTIIGISLLAIAKNSNISVSLTDVWTEFAGDGIQKIIDKIVEHVENYKENKKLKGIMLFNATAEDLNRYKQICIEVKKKEEEEAGETEKKGIFGKIKDKFASMASKITDMFSNDVSDMPDMRFISKFSESVLFELDFDDFLNENSNTFNSLKQEEKKNFVKRLELVVNIYRKDIFAKNSAETRVMASLVVSSLKLYMDNVEDRIVTRILAWFDGIAFDGKGINFQSIELAKYTPKYILNSCPECGYRGPRIYTNEKTNMTHCAACGSSYSIIKYCEPELWQKINDKIEKINKDSKELKELVGENRQDLRELNKNIKAGLEQVVTKDYLNACMNNNAELMSSIKIDIEKSYREYSAQIKNLSEQNKDIAKAIKEVNEQNKKSNEFLSSKLNSLEAQLSKIYDFAWHEFEGMGVKSDLILQYVQKLCSKEYFEEMSNALGTNMTRAINYNTEEIVALNTASVAQILEAISDLKKRGSSLKAEGEKDGEGEVFSASFERLICDQTAQLSGQVNGLQELIKNNHAQYSNAFRAIINSQDEIKAILLSKISISTNTHAFEKMYSGKIPDRYLYNEGFGGAFPCPYCGAEEERIINDEQYCRCSICGQKFLAVDLSQNIKNVDPFYRAEDSEEQTILNIIASKYGRNRNDPLLATEERIKKWLEYHSADITINEQDNTFVLKNPTSYGRRDIRNLTMDGFSKDKEPLLIIPYIEEFNNKIIHGNNYEFEVGTTFKDISILVFMYGIEYVDADMLRKFRAVNKIIFMPKKSANSGKYEYTFRTDADSAQGQNIHSSSRNRLFVPQGRDINVFGKSSGGQPIIVEKQ